MTTTIMTTSNIQIFLNLIGQLPWNESQAERSTRIALSKAIWAGLDESEVLQVIRTTPSASHLRQCPHVFHQTWAALADANPNQHLTEFEQLLHAAN